MGEHIVLGEGDRDQRFLEELCACRAINGYVMSKVDGNPNFGTRIEAISAQPGFSQICKSILIVSDNDDSPGDSFTKIKRQLNAIDFPSPPRPLEIAKKKGMPAIGILMLPHSNEAGCLETLLIPAMHAANTAQAVCVDTLMTCINAAAWPKKSSRDKLKVRCLISAVYQDDPMHGLMHCFSPHKGLIPLTHETFNPVAEVLQHFMAWAASDVAKWTDWKAANIPPT